VPAFYGRPASIDDIVTYTAVRLLDQLDVHVDARRWDGRLAVE
jgi:3-polyprenyl-4-hydroxybenzoate decarboxylase